jgi:hypothetical protein
MSRVIRSGRSTRSTRPAGPNQLGCPVDIWLVVSHRPNCLPSDEKRCRCQCVSEVNPCRGPDLRSVGIECSRRDIAWAESPPRRQARREGSAVPSTGIRGAVSPRVTAVWWRRCRDLPGLPWRGVVGCDAESEADAGRHDQANHQSHARNVLGTSDCQCGAFRKVAKWTKNASFLGCNPMATLVGLTRANAGPTVLGVEPAETRSRA